MGNVSERPPWADGNADATSVDVIPVEAMRRAALDGLNERFPGVPCWWGKVTGHYWAMVPDVGESGRLVEAETPGELAAGIERAQVGREWGRW